MLKMVDASGQISLGKKFAGRRFEVTEHEDGAIVMTLLPVPIDPDGWVNTPEMRERLQWMKENPPGETHLDDFFASIDEKRRAREEK